MLCKLRDVMQLGRTKKGDEAFKVPYKNAGRSARAIFIPYINIVQDRYHAIAINKAKNSVDICIALRRVPFALYRVHDAETFYFAGGMNQLRDAKAKRNVRHFRVPFPRVPVIKEGTRV